MGFALVTVVPRVCQGLCQGTDTLWAPFWQVWHLSVASAVAFCCYSRLFFVLQAGVWHFQSTVRVSLKSPACPALLGEEMGRLSSCCT